MNIDNVITPIFSFVAGLIRLLVKPGGGFDAGIFHTSVPGGSGGIGGAIASLKQTKQIK